MKYILVKTTFLKKIHAEKMAKILLEKKLIACAQISAIESFYFWNKKLNKNKEFLLSIKTKADFYQKVEKEIAKNHEYEVPQIISIKIDKISKNYEKWYKACIL